VPPAWDGSKTALAGSKSGLGWRNFGDPGPTFIAYPKPALAEPRPVPQNKLPNSSGACSAALSARTWLVSCRSGLPTMRARPKSASLSEPSGASNKLLGLRSRCKTHTWLGFEPSVSRVDAHNSVCGEEPGV
jgi:hypothetical protein